VPQTEEIGAVDCNRKWKQNNTLDSLERDLKRYGLETTIYLSVMIK